MKNINFLIIAASLSFSAFILSIAAGFISMPMFLISAVSWLSLIAIGSYTPRTRSWLPRTAEAKLLAQAGGEKAPLALAA